MATYQSSPVALRSSAQNIYDKLTNLNGLGEMIKNIPADQIPEDKRSMLDGIEVSDDTITIPGGPTGSISLRKGACVSPQTITYEGINTPVPVSLTAHIASTGAESCDVVVEADIKVPAMLKPMLNGPMKKMVEEVANSLTQLKLS